MSLKVGQYIKDSQTDYTIDIGENKIESTIRDNAEYPMWTGSAITDKGTFQDTCLQWIDEEDAFQENEYYYVKVALKKEQYKLLFNVVLRNNNDQTEDKPMEMYVQRDNILESINYNSNSSNYQIFEFCFQPNTTYNQLCFEIQRQATDYTRTSTTSDGRIVYGRILKFDTQNSSKSDAAFGNNGYYIKKIKNIKEIIGISDNTLVKIGIQAYPDFLFCINGEAVRVGTSGFYEMNNSLINIAFVGFVVPQEKDIASPELGFIFDYEYE